MAMSVLGLIGQIKKVRDIIVNEGPEALDKMAQAAEKIGTIIREIHNLFGDEEKASSKVTKAKLAMKGNHKQQAIWELEEMKDELGGDEPPKMEAKPVGDHTIFHSFLQQMLKAAIQLLLSKLTEKEEGVKGEKEEEPKKGKKNGNGE